MERLRLEAVEGAGVAWGHLHEEAQGATVVFWPRHPEGVAWEHPGEAGVPWALLGGHLGVEVPLGEAASLHHVALLVEHPGVLVPEVDLMVPHGDGEVLLVWVEEWLLHLLRWCLPPLAMKRITPMEALLLLPHMMEVPHMTPTPSKTSQKTPSQIHMLNQKLQIPIMMIMASLLHWTHLMAVLMVVVTVGAMVRQCPMAKCPLPGPATGHSHMPSLSVVPDTRTTDYMNSTLYNLAFGSIFGIVFAFLDSGVYCPSFNLCS